MRSFYRQYGKRWLDLCIAVPLLLLLSPLLLAVALVVRVKLGSPILFVQVRPGLHGKPFTIYKFRTMLDACDAAGKALPDAERLTAFGKFLRASSLDELPELWNVVRGDMSLVGPRPLLMQYLPLYTPRQARRHDVRPGVTGLAQVSGRNRLPWPAKFALDAQYVERCSLVLDISILLRTLLKVFSRDGISAEGHATAPAFTARFASLLSAEVAAPVAKLYKSSPSIAYEYKEVLAMDYDALLQTLDEVFERQPGTTRMDESLQDISEYSSLTFLSLIALIDERYGVTVAPDRLLACNKVSDLAALVQSCVAELNEAA